MVDDVNDLMSRLDDLMSEVSCMEREPQDVSDILGYLEEAYEDLRRVRAYFL